MKRGVFITVEGAEGCGKTTNMNYVVSYLERQGITVEASREPGGTPFAEEIRELLLSNRDEPVSEMAELLLMFAARSQHLQQRILPALEGGVWFVCDRFTDATFAYQGGGRGVDMKKIALLETVVQGSLRPDRVLLLDVPVRLGMERAVKRGELDRFESEKLDFYERVRNCYLVRSENSPDNYRVIDASVSLDGVQEQLKHALDELIAENRLRE